VDRAVAEDWIRVQVNPSGDIEIAHERPWSTVLRVPTGDGLVWFKACSAVQAFEPRLTAELFARWPHLVPEVIAYDEERAWLLMADAGARIADLDNPPWLWAELLPRYAELQRGEAALAVDHLTHGVPDLRLRTLPIRYAELLREDLPLEDAEIERLRGFESRFEEACGALAANGVPETIQHDDLHMNNVFTRDGRLRVLDWGDSCVSHPFASLLATFRFLEERNGLAPENPWLTRLRDAYLEPWGSGMTDTFALAMRVGAFAHAIAAERQRAALDGQDRRQFDEDFAIRLRRALRGV
jgi:hypothetical protein